MSGPITLLHRKDTDSWMSGRALFEIYSSCAIKLWNRSASAWDSLVESYAMLKRWWAAGESDSPFMSSGILSIIFPM